MPTYDYVCQACSHHFEHFQTMTSDPLKECPQCQGDLKRLIGSGAALIFKGSGFYCTDYKKPSLDKKVETTKEAAKEVKAASAASASSSSSSSDASSGSTSAA